MFCIEFFGFKGSETLHKWRSLAIPHLASVLETRPGVQVRGQHVDSCVEEEEYSISDLEEDGMLLSTSRFNIFYNK